MRLLYRKNPGKWNSFFFVGERIIIIVSGKFQFHLFLEKLQQFFFDLSCQFLILGGTGFRVIVPIVAIARCVGPGRVVLRFRLQWVRSASGERRTLRVLPLQPGRNAGSANSVGQISSIA